MVKNLKVMLFKVKLLSSLNWDLWFSNLIIDFTIKENTWVHTNERAAFTIPIVSLKS